MTIIQDDLMKKIIEDYNAGLSPNKLSEKYNDFSPYQIRENLKKCGVFRTLYFTDDELKSIKEDFESGLILKQLVQKYHRPEETIRKKLQSFGLYDARVQLPYSNEEVAILEKYYPLGDWDNLFKFLPNRDRASISTKASKLGISQTDWNWDECRVKEVLNKKGYTLLTKFENIKNKHKLIDSNGYLYCCTLMGLIYDKSLPLIFSQDNIYTIDNIKTYIKLNNINCELVSNTYTNNTSDLSWKCRCGKIFLCPWARFQAGKHQCNECSEIESFDKISFSIDDVEKMIEGKPYKMIRDTFTRLSNGFTAITNDGYYVLIDKNNIYKNTMPEIFHTNNPYTIDNIKHYIEMNGIRTKLISTTYDNNSKKLKWECGCCGKVFDRGWNSFLNGATECLDCSSNKRGINSRISAFEIKEFIESNGYYLGENIEDIAISNKKFSIYDDEGYFYETTWSHMKSHKTPEKFHPNNKHTINNINHYMDLHRNGEYQCISKIYKANDGIMKFKHIPCGCEFKATWTEMQGKLMLNKKDRYFKQCPNCNTNKTESIHASTLKQVFLHEHPDTITEDKSCINPKTNRPLPTDIVNHRLRIAIEIQSDYHDTEERKLVDTFKKEFWLDKGYAFYDPDIRDYSILEMIQVFFPNISSIPKYVDFKFSDCIDFRKVQKLLNGGYTISEISKILNIKKGTIQGFINNKKVSLPKDYKKRIFNIKPIVRISKSGEFMERFESLYEANTKGFSSGTIGRVLRGKQSFSYDSFWVYEEDYLTGNYKIPETKFDKFTLPVDKYDMNNDFICGYVSIYEAELDSKSDRNEIYRVATGDRKSCKEEKWKLHKVA